RGLLAIMRAAREPCPAPATNLSLEHSFREQIMSNHDDSVFVRNFSLVLVGLCVVGILAFILAKVVTRSAQENYIPSDGVAARVAPMGQVNTGSESLSIAATTPAPAAAGGNDESATAADGAAA